MTAPAPESKPPPPPSQREALDAFLRTWPGALGLGLVGFVVYVVCAHFVPTLALVIASGITDPVEVEAFAIRNIPTIVSAGTLVTLGLLAAVKALGVLPDDPPRAEAKWIVAWVVGGIAVCTGGQEAISYLQSQLGTPAQEQAALVDAARTGGLAFLFAVVVVGPVGEELAFRRFLFTTFERGGGPWLAYPLSALLFAVLHFNPSALLLYVWIGTWCAVVYARTGTIWAAIVVHVVNNGFALSQLDFGG